jgi:hypothetical protein
MSIPEWQTVQCYIVAGIQLPTTPQEAVTILGVASEDAAKLTDLWQA